MSSIPFFCDLPAAAIKPAQELWDVVDTDGYNPLRAYHDFVRKLEAAGIQPPTRSMVTRWTAGVECGLILRPETGENKLRSRPAPSADTGDIVPAEVVPAPSPTPATSPVTEEKRKTGTLKLPKAKAETARPVDPVPVPEPLEALMREIADAPALVDADGPEVDFELPDLRGHFIRDEGPQPTEPLEIVAASAVAGGVVGEIAESDREAKSASKDPVQEAVDFIINHYLEQELAKARIEAARKAAAVLREFADRIEASA